MKWQLELTTYTEYLLLFEIRQSFWYVQVFYNPETSTYSIQGFLNRDAPAMTEDDQYVVPAVWLQAHLSSTAENLLRTAVPTIESPMVILINRFANFSSDLTRDIIIVENSKEKARYVLNQVPSGVNFIEKTIIETYKATNQEINDIIIDEINNVIDNSKTNIPVFNCEGEEDCVDSVENQDILTKCVDLFKSGNT